MKKRIERLLPAALQAIHAVLKPEKKPIQAEYQGYISAFGASVMQMGLLPTLAVFADKDSGSAQDRSTLLRILHRIAASQHSGLTPELKKQLGDNDEGLFESVVGLADKDYQMREIRACLLDAAIATKLSIRTFKLVRNEQIAAE